MQQKDPALMTPVSDPIVVTAKLPFNHSIYAARMWDLFSLRHSTWAPTGGSRTLAEALSAPGVRAVDFAAKDDAPATDLESRDNDGDTEEEQRADTLATLLNYAPTEDSKVASALQELRDNNVTWKVIVVEDYTEQQKDAIRDAGGDPNTTRAITYLPQSGEFSDGQTLYTYIHSDAADTRQDFGRILTHELLHIRRTPAGNFTINESQIMDEEPASYNDIFLGNRTEAFTGSASESAVTTGSSGSDTIYAASGNNFVYAGDGNNNLVSYGGNDYLIAGSGHDHYDILSNGAKIIDDRNGSDTLFIPWIDSTADLQFWQDGTTLYIDATYGTEDSAIDRIAIENWADGFGRGKIETLHYLNSQGSMRTANLTELAQEQLGLAGGGGWNLNSKLEPLGASEIMTGLPGGVFGEPLPGFSDHLQFDELDEPAPPPRSVFAAAEDEILVAAPELRADAEPLVYGGQPAEFFG